jgi:GH15 family glucan-1,4-alpha-glucosidase
LSTLWETPGGQVEVIDFMPHGGGRSDIVRRVRGVSGSVDMHLDLRIRFGYASSVPWVRQLKHEPLQGGEPHPLVAVAGPDACVIRGVRMHAEGRKHVADFTVQAGETLDLQLSWYPSHRPTPAPIDAEESQRLTAEWWRDWARSCSHDGPYREAVVRSMLVLRALTNEETGGIVAAATTSLPEEPGGMRNWDYRYVWLRDASLSLKVLLGQGYAREAEAWRNWLMRAIAGDPRDLQIKYGLAGEPEQPERLLTTLPR